MAKVLINASNLHHGGGIQVAASFIYELHFLCSNTETDFTVILSSEVKNSIPKDINWKVFENVIEENIFGVSVGTLKFRRLFSSFDLCLTVFGPNYIVKGCRFNIVGFAQPWIIYPDNCLYLSMSKLMFLKTKLKFYIQKAFFRSADVLIVEHDLVKRKLVELGFKENKISVVNNSVSSYFLESDCLTHNKLKRFGGEQDFNIGFLGRGYPHKNLKILFDVDKLLKVKYNIKCNFIFTLTPEEMNEHGFSLLDNFYSYGAINSQLCPSFYNAIDALIFPSLLECFSATPLEAMYMRVPLIASDLPFVTDICHDAATYFDPNSADDIAKSIVRVVVNEEETKNKVCVGSRLVESGFTAKQRANMYLSIIDSALKGYYV
ncbi:glycosyltransferase [Shewanella algae]|uniref:glycosyltransferase n=1 Tax=Shewanella algae TaxID=38313 RepID=UPI00313F15EA